MYTGCIFSFNFRMNCYKELTICLECLHSKQINNQNNVTTNSILISSSTITQEQIGVGIKKYIYRVFILYIIKKFKKF